MKLLRFRPACEKLGYTRSTFYRVMKEDPEFPKPIETTPDGKIIAFLETELDRYIELLVARRDAGLGAKSRWRAPVHLQQRRPGRPRKTPTTEEQTDAAEAAKQRWEAPMHERAFVPALAAPEEEPVPQHEKAAPGRSRSGR